MKQLLLALIVAGIGSGVTVPAHAAPHKIACPKGTTCCDTGNDGGNFAPITGPIPVLNYEINDALMTALTSLQTSNPAAYTALADTLAKLPPEKRNALSGGLGIEVEKGTVTTSPDLKLMVQMNRSSVRNF